MNASINWGKGIVIAFALFISFIMYFVFKVQSNDKYDNELVVDKYYQKELVFEQQLEKQHNALNLKEKVKINVSHGSISIQFPSSFNYTKISGTVSLYRPSSQKLDVEIPISLSSSYLLIPKSNLADGRWDISIDWTYEGTSYLNTATIQL